ncbi:NDR1/HIN1-like protein [Pyrococcus yayanosii]|uniref:Water stress and hypersensitive response domain-containing protein n=1 Tax=Pyrococcus yayanosii (strain CH1 / JCM 16557) TaxID=529709 RepID=F8AI68_PYRYC|nr:LEA type 2 family protein [Pyrococcus yayanosii]AEH24295.1 hypothetical protein PYCH_06070 [Pyrococcus yayanosii CH1]
MKRSLLVLVSLIMAIPLINFGYLAIQYFAVGPVKDCKIELSEVKVEEASVDGAILVATVTIDNPTDRSVRIDGFEYTLFANDTPIGTYKISRIILIPAGSSIKLKGTFEVRYPTMPTGIIRAIMNGRLEEIEWRIEGEFYVNSTLGTFGVLFNVTTGR